MYIVVLGAGITGLATALELQRQGHTEYSLYEQEPVAGGLCRSHSMDGFRFDSVSHVLHFRSPQVLQQVKELMPAGLTASRRDAAIYFAGRYVPYPFQTHLGFLPAQDGLACLAGMIRARIKDALVHREPRNFAEWIQAEFGSGIARRFMTPYNRRLWGIDPGKMTLDWMRFVPRAPLRPVLASFFAGKTPQGYNTQFLYPASGGIQSLVEGMSARVAPLHLGKKVVEIDPRRKRVVFQDGESRDYDLLISTLPLNLLAALCRETPESEREAAGKLRSVPVVSITFGLRHPARRPHHWVYFPQDEFPYFRLFFNSNVDPQSAPDGTSIVSAEFAHAGADDAGRLLAQTVESFQSLELISSPADIAFSCSTVIPCGYPVHDLQRSSAVETLTEYFRGLDIWTVGRFGGWRYCSIEDGFADAALVVRQVLSPDRRFSLDEV